MRPIPIAILAMLALPGTFAFAQSRPANVHFQAPAALPGGVELVTQPPASTRGLAPEARTPSVQFGLASALPDGFLKPSAQAGSVVLVQEQRAKPSGTPGVLVYPFHLTPPSAGRLFQLDSEESFRQRLQSELQQRSPAQRLEFPGAEVLPSKEPQLRDWPALVKKVEPAYVISGRLFFEQRQFERYGQYCGVLQPALSAGWFGIDVLAFPVRRILHPFQRYQVNSDLESYFFERDRRP